MKGEEIAGRIDPHAWVPGTAAPFRSEISRWSIYNGDLLRSLFDTDEIATTYEIHMMFGTPDFRGHENRELEHHLNSLRERLDNLRTVVDRLEVFDLAPGVGGTAQAVSQQNAGRPPSTVINISHSTFGSLTMGDVRGSIENHVSGVIGSPSADGFRQAVEALADAIQNDEALPDAERQRAMESIDGLAEEAGRPPHTRRLGVVLPLLAAIPEAIRLGGQAVDAWEKYSGPIRGLFGQ